MARACNSVAKLPRILIKLWQLPPMLAIMRGIIREIGRMRRLVLVLVVVAFGAVLGHAAEQRFPRTGAHAFVFELPRGWVTKTDARGGLLLVPPAENQHAMVYIGIISNGALRGRSLEEVAAQAAKPSGIARFDKQEPARITDTKGAVHRGAAFFGRMPEKRGLWRNAKIVIVPLGPGVWAQAWTVAQSGINAAEQRALDAVLASLTLAAP